MGAAVAQAFSPPFASMAQLLESPVAVAAAAAAARLAAAAAAAAAFAERPCYDTKDRPSRGGGRCYYGCSSSVNIS